MIDARTVVGKLTVVKHACNSFRFAGYSHLTNGLLQLLDFVILKKDLGIHKRDVMKTLSHLTYNDLLSNYIRICSQSSNVSA